MTTALVACLVLAWQGDPEGILRSRGLELVGPCWLLPEDIAAEPEARRLLGEIQQIGNDQDRVRSEGGQLQQATAERTRRIEQLRTSNPQDPNQYQQQQERGRLEDEQAAARERMANLSDRAADNARAIERNRREIEILYRDVMAAYRRLNADKEVVKALVEVNRKANPWQTLGPASKHEANVLTLAAYVMKANRLERKGARWSFPTDADLNPLLARASATRSRLKEATGKDRESIREELSAQVEGIRTRYRRIQEDYRKVRADSLVRGALEESNKRAKSRAEIGPQRDFERIPRRLDDMMADP